MLLNLFDWLFIFLDSRQNDFSRSRSLDRGVSIRRTSGSGFEYVKKVDIILQFSLFLFKGTRPGSIKELMSMMQNDY